jgi:hypothetical protein
MPEQGGEIDMFQGPQNLQTILNYDDVSFERVGTTFSSASDPLTTNFRQNGQLNHSTPATGQVMRNETYLEVRYA